MIICSHCHTENKATARFCNECGKPCPSNEPPARPRSVVTSQLEPVLSVHIAAAPPLTEVVEALTAPSFLRNEQQRAAQVPTPVPAWPEPFQELKPHAIPGPAPKSATPHRLPSDSVTRYGLFGLGLALLIAAVAGVVAFSKLRTVAPVATAQPTKPGTAARAIEPLSPPDLTNGKGVATPPPLRQ